MDCILVFLIKILNFKKLLVFYVMTALGYRVKRSVFSWLNCLVLARPRADF